MKPDTNQGDRVTTMAVRQPSDAPMQCRVRLVNFNISTAVVELGTLNLEFN